MHGLRTASAAVALAWGIALALGGPAGAATSDPADLGGLELWLDAQDVDGDGSPDSLSDGDAVATWVDKSGNANDATQAAGGSRATYRTNVLHGLPVLRFDGYDDWYGFTAITDIRTVFWVIKEDPAASVPTFLMGHDSTYHFHRDASGTKYMWGGNTHTNVRDGTTRLDGTVVDGESTPVPTTFAIIDLVTTGNVEANQLTHDRSIAGRSWHGDIAEVIIYNRALSDAEVRWVERYLRGRWFAGSLVAHWELDDGSGDTATDSAGTNDGTLSPNFPSNAPQWVVGKVGSGALSFDGTDDRVEATGYKGILGRNPRTVTAWVKTTASDASIISWGTNTAGEKWVFRVQDANGTAGAIRVEISGGYIVGSTPVHDGRWHHVAATWFNDGSTNVTDTLLYVDGSLETASATNGQTLDTTSGADVKIGIRHGNSGPFTGSIDDVRIYNRVLWAAEIAELAGELIAHWKLDDGTGSSTASDSSGHGHTATLTNMDPATDWVAGRIGAGALEFDGADDFVALEDSSSPGFLHDAFAQRTVAMWMKADTTSGRMSLFDEGGAANGLAIRIDSGRLEAGVSDGSTRVSTGTAFADTTTWHHVAAVFDNGDLRLYLDGTEVGSTTAGYATVSSHSDMAGLGARNNDDAFDGSNTGDYFDGFIDDVRVYSRALSVLELQEAIDFGNVIVSPAWVLATTEAGGQATFTVVLGSAPTADVTIEVSSSDTGEGVIEGATAGVLTLLFTPADWDAPQPVTVTGVDDALVDLHALYTVDLAASSADALYDGCVRAVRLTNRDDKIDMTLVAWWRFDETGGTTAENAVSPGLFDGALTNMAGSEWTAGQVGGALAFDGSNDYVHCGTGIGLAGGSFTVAAWATRASAGDDHWIIGHGPTGIADSSLHFGFRSSDVFAFAFWSDDLNSSLTYTDTNEWHHWVGTYDASTQTQTLYRDGVAVDTRTAGADYQGTGTFYVGRRGDGPYFDGLLDDVRVYDRALSGPEVADLHERGLTTVKPTLGLVTTEGGPEATFEVYLNSQPAADVTISLTSSDTSAGVITGATGNELILTFTDADWSTPQTVTVTAVDDSVDDGDSIYRIDTAIASSGDPTYDGIEIENVLLTTVDDDTAGVTVNAAASLDTTEASPGTATFTVVLDSEPTAEVTVGIASSDTSEGTVSASVLTFTALDWNTEQTVTVTGVDDDVDDGDVTYTIITSNASSGDPLYDGFDVADVSAMNIDDDTAGITVDPPSGLVTTEDPTLAAHTATFTVRLNSEPLDDVTISLSSSDTGEGTIDAAVGNVLTLTFTPADWNTEQTIAVTGVDDALGDEDVPYSIEFDPASSADVLYDGMQAVDALVLNYDDEPVVTVTASVAAISEPSGTVTFTITRDAAKPGESLDVYYTFPGSAAAGVDFAEDRGGMVTIVDADLFEEVVVTVIDDRREEGDETLAFALVRDETLGYSVGPPGMVIVTIADDERPGIGGGTACGVPGHTGAPGGGSAALCLLSALAAVVLARRRFGRRFGHPFSDEE